MKNPVAAIFAPRLWLSILFLLFMAGYAKADAVEKASEWSFQTGFDAWRLYPSVKEDLEPGYVEANSNLLLPNSYATWNYKGNSPFARITGDVAFTRDVSFSLKARADQNMGPRIDELDITWALSPKLGFRAGVVDYKTSWCRTYETHSIWMREVDPLCSTPQLRDITGGAPGLQAYTNAEWGDYLLQTQVGIYYPLLFHYAPYEFGNVIVPPDSGTSVVSNHKAGVNLSAVNLQNGLEARLSYIYAQQTAVTPSAQNTVQQAYNLIYLGLSATVAPDSRLTLTGSWRNLNNAARSPLADPYNNEDLYMKFQTKVVELTRQLDGKNQLGVSWGYVLINTDVNFVYNPVQAVYPAFVIPTHLYGLSWRHDYSKGLFTILEYLHSQAGTFSASDVSGFDQQYYPSYGRALGFRLGYQY
jgi:hypothetical protein